MIINVPSSVFSDLCDRIVDKVNDNRESEKTFSLEDEFKSVLKSVTNGRYAEFADTREYQWNKTLPTVSDLISKGDTLYNYCSEYLCLYLQFIISSAEAQLKICADSHFKTPSEITPETKDFVVIHFIPHSFVQRVVTSLTFKDMEKIGIVKAKTFFTYIDDINIGMSKESIDYETMAYYYDRVVTTVGGLKDVTHINLEDVYVEHEDLKKLVKSNQVKVNTPLDNFQSLPLTWQITLISLVIFVILVLFGLLIYSVH